MRSLPRRSARTCRETRATRRVSVLTAAEAEDAGGDVVLLADRDQAMAVDEAQGAPGRFDHMHGCQPVRKHVSERDLNPHDRDLRRCSLDPHRETDNRRSEACKGFVSEDRHAPYIHDQHHPEQGVRCAASRRVVTTADGVIRTTTMGAARDG